MSNVVRKFFVDSFKNLHFRIFTVGYPGYGESILSVIYDGDKPLFSVVTDCYQTDNNHISNILSDLGITKIDYFIWTHPDNDHSVGIKDFLSHFDPNGQADVFLPQSLGAVTSMSTEAKSAFDYILKKYDSRQKYASRPLSIDYRDGQIINPVKDCIEFVDGKRNRHICCEFVFLLPHSQMIQRIVGMQKFTLNDLSIFYYVKFNGYMYIFGGDLDKQSLQFLDLSEFQNVAFVKIPHHGSDKVVSFPNGLINNGYAEAVCTCTQFVKGKSNLPIGSTLKQYRPFSKRIYRTTKGTSACGCIDVDFNIHNLQTTISRVGNTSVSYRQRVAHQKH